jgi:hypothetical protein
MSPPPMDNHDVYDFIKNFDRRTRRERERNNQQDPNSNKRIDSKLTLADLQRPEGKPSIGTFIKNDD